MSWDVMTAIASISRFALFLRASALRANRLEGVRVGADRTLPGALVRHVNALSVAISCLAYGHCRGYTSLRSVDQALYDGGLNYGKTGADPNAFHDANLINKALKRAASLPAPGMGVNTMGPHEKGLAFFYVEPPDLNAVHGSRYLPLPAIVPGLHLLMLFERGSCHSISNRNRSRSSGRTVSRYVLTLEWPLDVGRPGSLLFALQSRRGPIAAPAQNGKVQTWGSSEFY